MSNEEQRGPLWWQKVNSDLTKAVFSAKKSFNNPGVVVGFTGDIDDKKDFLVRLPDGNIGLYSKDNIGNDLPTGVKIKNNLPDPDSIQLEADLDSFIFEVLREQIKLLPRMWLKRSISLLLNNKQLKVPKITFSDWVLLSRTKRQDRYLTNLLESGVKYEGLKGLSRYNDYASGS